MSANEPEPPEVTEDFESLLITFGIFAMITIVVYYWILAPILSLGEATNQPQDRHNQHAGGQQQQQQQRRQTPTPRRQNAQQLQNSNAIKSSEVLSMLASNGRCPVHVSSASSSRAGIGGASLLVDGMIPFRHGHSASYEQSKFDAETITQNRRDRARLLTRVLALEAKNGNTDATASSNSTSALSSTSPPSRGSTLVVSIPHYDAECGKLRRILFLLATYYNLLVIINFPTITEEKENNHNDISAVIEKLRGERTMDLLPENVLPSHRILASQSVIGRIAVVRQLGKVEIVLDFDEEMKQALNRFGYRVCVYGKDLQDSKKQHQLSASSTTTISSSQSTSLIGESLLS